MKAVLVCGGDAPSGSLLIDRCNGADLVVAADSGLEACLENGVSPDRLVGDLDSADLKTVTQAREHGVQVEELPEEKDETDLERAAWLALKMGADEICILGAFGGRLDHLLGNLAVLLWCSEQGARSCMEDDAELIYAMNGARLVLDLPLGTTLSIVPAGQEAAVSASGLYYPLENLVLTNDHARGISNVSIEPQVSIESEGSLYVIVNKKS